MPFRIIFAGTPVFAVPCLEALIRAGHTIAAVYTQPDRPAGRGQKITASPVKVCAISHELPVFQPKTLRDPQAQQELAALKADLMVVVAYGLLLPAPVLATPRLGCVNVHASLLPRFRGAAPIQRAILAGDAETGITLMQMDEGLDTGAMLLKATCPIGNSDTTGTLHDQLSLLGADTLIKGLETFSRLTPVAQDEKNATYATKIQKTEARINWTQPAEIIARAIRAFNPWPGAFTGSDQAPVKIWQAQALRTASGRFDPGQIARAEGSMLDVATGEGLLRIEKLQLPGGKMISAADFTNARQAQQLQGRLMSSDDGIA